jgi:hypothetical protein
MAKLFIKDFAVIDYKEVPGSRTFSYVGNQAKGTCIYDVRWEDRFKFMTGIMGFSQLKYINTSGPRIKRFKPFAYPEYTKIDSDASVLFASGIESVEPVVPKRIPKADIDFIDGVGDNIPYCLARIKVSFSSPAFSYHEPTQELEAEQGVLTSHLGNPGDVLDNINKPKRDYNISTYITKIVQPSMEVLRLPYGYMRWANGLKDAQGNILAKPGEGNITGVFKMKPQSDITYIFHQIPALPRKGWLVEDEVDLTGSLGEELLGGVFTHVGCVNDSTFDSYKTETLLLKAIEAKPYRWIDGKRYYDYVYHMAHFNPVENLGELIKLDADSNPEKIGEIIGHNHFIRLQPPKKDGANSITVEPFYSLLTVDGTFQGKGVFELRNFYDLFTPFNRSYLTNLYK